MCANNYRNKGFTLIEILVVVFIIGLLAAVVLPRLMGTTDEARVEQVKLQIRNIETALKLFKLHNGFYPSTEQGLDALIRKPTTGRIPEKYREGGYLESNNVPRDPWGNDFIYLSPGMERDYDLISYGADNAPGGEGFDADIENWNIK